MEAEATCPYCGEPIQLWIDLGGGGEQRYVEDCSVCCRPIEVVVAIGETEDDVSIDVRRGDD